MEINGVTGVVQDRALLVTLLQTPRNELVSMPNASVIGGSVTNRRRVHTLRLDATRSVAGVSASP